MDAPELEAGYTINRFLTDVTGNMFATFLHPEVHDALFDFACVEEQVIVSTLHGQVLHRLLVGCVIVVTDEVVVNVVQGLVCSCFKPK